MPRRTRASNNDASTATSPPPTQHDLYAENLSLLRKQWKWAAFSQFFCTFSQLFAMNDVTVSDIERDLVYQTSTVIPRIMQRLLYTLSYDRKVTLDNWQSALRKQYMKRDPSANPIGIEPEDLKSRAKTEPTEDEASALHNADTDAMSVEDRDDEEHSSKQSTSASRGASCDVAKDSELRLDRASVCSGSPSSAKDAHMPDAQDAAGGELKEKQETSVDWFDLPMITKLDSMHTLTEWQFQNATRLRTIMKSDDEFASWRIEPIGYDSKSNAYWFIGGDRLWIQRVHPKPVKPRSLKRKRTLDKPGNAKSKTAPTPKRPKLDPQMLKSDPKSHASDVPSFGRKSRAAKDQAKLKLDLQARELARLKHEAGILEQESRPRRVSSKTQPQKRIIGTRTSARLRGSQDNEWQPIPDEWLENETATLNGIKPTITRTGLESDQETVSDLTELSEEAGEARDPKSQETKDNGILSPHVDSNLENEPEQARHTPPGFVEWETICVTLHEWEHIAERFEKAAHYAEKALYKVLVNDIVPAVTQELRETQRKRELEEALVHRKRSSRIALKESEREEARLAAKRKQEEEEKQSRAKRLEARLQKEEAERIRRENAREQRRKEREAREEARQASAAPEAKQDVRSDKQKRLSPSGTVQRRQEVSNNGSRTLASDDWELSCEICQRHGRNLDDGTPMMSCGHCSKWQHIRCHDRADQAAGRPPRNWDSVDFVCKKCRTAWPEHYKDYNNRSFPRELHSAMHAPQPSASRSYQQAMPPFVAREHPYATTFRDPNHQGFYIRSANAQPVNSDFQAGPAPNIMPRSTISFSHYQPAAHNFSGHKVYSESRPNYSQAIPQFRPASQSHGTQAFVPGWNGPASMHNPGYSYSQNGHPVASTPVSLRGLQGDHLAMDHTPQALHSFPQPHYPPTQYLSNQFKHHSASYQSPSDRQ